MKHMTLGEVTNALRLASAAVMADLRIRDVLIADLRAELARYRKRDVLRRWRHTHRYDPREGRIAERLHERWMDHPATDYIDYDAPGDMASRRRWNTLDPMDEVCRSWRRRVARLPLAGPKGVLP